MDFSIYLEPVEEKLALLDNWPDNTIGRTIKHYEEGTNIAKFDIAILGIKEERGTIQNHGCGSAPEFVRPQLYKLFNHFGDKKILDLGNIKAGEQLSDTYFAIQEVVVDCIKKEVLPIIIGGSQDLTFAIYKAYEKLEQTVNLVTVDPSIDLGVITDEVNEKNFVNQIVMHQPNYLFNYSNIGYQTYFVDRDVLGLMDRLYFDASRLGNVRADMQGVESSIRDADILSFDIGAIKNADAPGNSYVSPNGFTGDEACRIARYAGISDKLSALGIFNFNPARDTDNATAMLIAQMIWYFIDGYLNRLGDYPVASKSSYTKFHVSMEEEKHELTFYKSEKSSRWWMEVPFPGDLNKKFVRHQMVPCTYEDYLNACNGEMPDKWWQTYQKLG